MSLLLDQAAAERRSRVGVRAAADLIGHGIEARIDAALRWLPWRFREQVAMAALVVAAGLSLIMLLGEMIGAHYRSRYGISNRAYFTSGPFLTIGVGMYAGYLTAALLCVAERAGLTRLLVLVTTAFAVWMQWGMGFGDPRPQVFVLVLFVMLGVLASLASITTTRSSARRLIGYGAAFVVLLGGATLLTKPVLEWSVGTMATSGMVAFAALATALPFICAGALVYAGFITARRPGWLAATAVTTFPLVVFCTAVNQIITGPYRSDVILLTPLYYVLAAVLVALAGRRVRRRPSTS